ncbi:MAG: DUF2971 domain-containing protein [Pseudomonadota bacterium]
MTKNQQTTTSRSGALEARLKHPCFPQPENTSIKVWRYMDFVKFVWLLTHKQLYFTRLDLLSDTHEGSVTPQTAKGIDKFLKSRGAKVGWEQLSKIYQASRRTTFVNCWYASNNESEAMWRLYCGAGHGVAVQTTYASLVDSIKNNNDLFIGLVSYIDYEREGFPSANVFYPVMHKRLAFSHEREVRMVISPTKYRAAPPEPAPLGLTVEWDPTSLIEAVYVDPYAPEYYYEAAQSIVENLAPGLVRKLVWSQMKSVPII